MAGNEAQAGIHLAGLVELISMRGGLQSLGCDSILGILTRW
jgi:hypothetical protein